MLKHRANLCVTLMFMSTSHIAQAATLADLHWMVGAWAGPLGPQTVEEDWSAPAGGTMSTMVRLSSATETIMIELIVIREENESLILHLRQFSPSLMLVLSQDMPLESLSSERVAFAGPVDDAIKMLAYRNISPEQMEVDVTVADGTVLTAKLRRP